MICVGKVLPKILAQSPSWGGVPFREPPFALCQIHDVRYGVFKELFKELFRELSRELFSLALALVSSASVECRLLLSSVCMHASVCIRVHAC